MPMHDAADLKRAIHWHCHRLLADRLAQTRSEIERCRMVAQAGGNTSVNARIELEKLHAVLEQLQAMAPVLADIDPAGHHVSIVPGALVRTDMGLFYIAVALGRTEVEGVPLWVVAPNAPIVQVLKDTPVGEIAFFNGQAFRMQLVA